MTVERRHPVEAVIIDGQMWLREGQPGPGARLHEALGARKVVIGVAKAAFAGGSAVPVLRGDSSRPLYVTAAGTNAHGAAKLVRGMHGPHRVPTLLKRADQLARGHAALDPAKARVCQMSCCARRPLFGELKAHSQNNADAR